MANIIYQGTPTSFPHAFNYTPSGDGDGLIQFSGSAWSGGVDKTIGLYLKISGEQVATAEIFSNGSSTHRRLNTGYANHRFSLNVIDGEIQPVEIEIGLLNSDTTFDINDSVSIVSF